MDRASTVGNGVTTGNQLWSKQMKLEDELQILHVRLSENRLEYTKGFTFIFGILMVNILILIAFVMTENHKLATQIKELQQQCQSKPK